MTTTLEPGIKKGKGVGVCVYVGNVSRKSLTDFTQCFLISTAINLTGKLFNEILTTVNILEIKDGNNICTL